MQRDALCTVALSLTSWRGTARRLTVLVESFAPSLPSPSRAFGSLV